MTCTAKGESVWQTNSSKLMDTRPLMAFIIISIFAFIICISCAMHTAPLSSLDGRLVSSYRSRLLAALFLPNLPFLADPSLGDGCCCAHHFPFIMLVIGTSFVPLVQLLLQLLITLGESLDYCGEGLHLPFQGVEGVFRSPG